MDHKLVYHDGGVRRTRVVSDDGILRGTLTEVDLTEMVDNNRALAEIHPVGSVNKLVARIPMTVVEKAMIEGWMEDEDAWKRWLNDPDNKHYRIWPGRV